MPFMSLALRSYVLPQSTPAKERPMAYMCNFSVQDSMVSVLHMTQPSVSNVMAGRLHSNSVSHEASQDLKQN